MARACYRERNTLLGRLKDNKTARKARVGGVPQNPSGRCLYAGWITWLSGFSFMSFPFPFLSPRLKSRIFVMSTQASRTCVASNPLCFHLGHGYLRVLPALWSSMLRTHRGATHLVVLPNTPEHPANSFLVPLFRGKPDFCHGPVRFQAQTSVTRLCS